MAVFQYDHGTTGLTLYAFMRPYGLATIWNGAAFVAYNVSNWTSYAITMTEQASSGTYFGTWPNVNTGTYNFTIYHQLGGSPASSDTLVGSGPLDFVAASPPSPGTLPTPAGVWAVPNADSANQSAGVLTARPDDFRFYVFDFGDMPQVQAGAVISTAVIIGATVTISDLEFDNYRCGAWITGGAVGVDYEVTAEVSLTDGTAINPVGTYRVRTA